MSTILLIDDDETLHKFLGDFLEQEKYQVIHAESGLDGLQYLFAEKPDLVILDIMMPHMDGWTVLARIREMTTLPVILLTAKDEESDKLQGFRLGGDDYLTKPFSFAELQARVEAVLKRTHSNQNGQSNTTLLQVGNLQLDRYRHIVLRDGQAVQLTPTEFSLLETLMSQPGHVFTQEQLVLHIWGDEYAEEIGYIRRYIWYLRQKIEPNPDEPQYILTERGIGYKMVDK